MAKQRKNEALVSSTEATIENDEATVDASQDDGLVEVIASSLSTPGHRRGGHFWPAGILAKARLTPVQADQVRKDKRITVFDPNAAIPSTEEIEANYQEHIREEMNKIADEQRRAQAVDNVRRRTEPSAGPRDFADRRR